MNDTPADTKVIDNLSRQVRVAEADYLGALHKLKKAKEHVDSTKQKLETLRDTLELLKHLEIEGVRSGK